MPDDEKKRARRAKQGLTEEQLQEIREVFEQFDSDGGGSIDVDELRMAMKSLGQNLTKAEAEALMLELDTGGDGSIEFSEFVEFIKPKILGQDFQEEVKGQFAEFASVPQTDTSGNAQKNKFDEDEMAYITKDGLRKIAQEIGERCNDEELDEIIEYCSKGDDKIDRESFMTLCKTMRLF